MIDLEREIREVLERRGDEAARRAESRMPDGTRTLVRRRQVRAVAFSTVAVVVIAVAALAGARALIPTTDRQPGTDPSITGPVEMPEMTVVASGGFRGQSWRILASQGKASCFEIETRTKGLGSSTGSCGDPLKSRAMWATALGGPGFPAVVVGGAVSNDVTSVVFDLDAGGQIRGKMHPLPEAMGAPFDVFIIVVPNERSARGVVMALDAEGEVLAQHGVYR